MTDEKKTVGNTQKPGRKSHRRWVVEEGAQDTSNWAMPVLTGNSHFLVDFLSGRGCLAGDFVRKCFVVLF
jgi:hypothetical protein